MTAKSEPGHHHGFMTVHAHADPVCGRALCVKGSLAWLSYRTLGRTEVSTNGKFSAWPELNWIPLLA